MASFSGLSFIGSEPQYTVQRTMACPDENQIALFVQGMLAPERSRAIEVHVDGCGDCAALMAELGRVAAAGDRAVPGPAPSGESAYRREQPVPGEPVGRYLVGRLLGAGSMGEVFLAHDPLLRRDVALKLVHRRRRVSAADAELAEERLLREARAMAAVAHQSVVPVYDAGRWGDAIFLAMEYVEGTTLADWLAETPRPWAAVLERFLTTAEGLQAAHEAGVLHRDFKPRNVLVGRDGRVRVTDFGLARSEPTGGEPAVVESGVRSDGDLTFAGGIVGTPAYMAPEQLFGRPVDARADQFAFCVALFEAFFGVRPWVGTSVEELRWRLVEQHEPLLPADRRGVPAPVIDVLRRGLRLAPEERWPSMRELCDALRRTADRAGEVHVHAHAAFQALFTLGHAIAIFYFGRAMAAEGAETVVSSPVAASSGDGSALTGAVFLVILSAFLLFLSAGLVWAPINALGLWRRKPWARRSTLWYALLGISSCVGIPYAIYAVWSLRRSDVRHALRD
jgi:eukaryotic-like serine/threonine-protein kinase